MKPMPFTRFCGEVLGITLEPAQRVFYAVAGGEQQPHELVGSDRELAHEIFGNVDDVPPEALPVVAMIKGADVGATFLGGARSLWRALTAPRGDAAAGEVRPALQVAPDIRLGRKAVGVARGFAKSNSKIARLIHSESADSITFGRDGGWFSAVACLPATGGGRATRGTRWLEADMDEAAFFRDDTGAISDVQVFQSVVARCIGQVWLKSTPWLESNLIWKLYEENFGAPRSALAARMPTLLVRTSPRTREMVERERQRDADNAAREYDCQALSGASSVFFDPHMLAASVDHELQPFTEVSA